MAPGTAAITASPSVRVSGLRHLEARACTSCADTLGAQPAAVVHQGRKGFGCHTEVSVSVEGVVGVDEKNGVLDAFLVTEVLGDLAPAAEAGRAHEV